MPKNKHKSTTQKS